MKQPVMAAIDESDIRKKGYLLKIKTSKKKLFVLREESSSGPARLEYYDSEKKLRVGGLARRCILLKSCFSINAKSDGTRHRHAIILYTKDDCFGVACDSETEQQDWLGEMLELRRQSLEATSTQTRPQIKHVWPVSVETIAGKCDLVPPGSYRLCLTATNMTLIPLASGTNEIVVPLDSIRCCGHGQRLFLVEVDRSSMVDAGELWLTTDDSVVAQCIHDRLVDVLESSNADTKQKFRGRAHTSTCMGSGTTCDARRNIMTRLKRRPMSVRIDTTSSSRHVAWSETLEQQIKEGRLPGTDYFVMKPGSSSGAHLTSSDSGYIEMKPPSNAAYVDMTVKPVHDAENNVCGRSTKGADGAKTKFVLTSRKRDNVSDAYMDMTPCSSSFSSLGNPSVLASRMNAVRSYFQEGSESNEDSDDSGEMGNVEELPLKERAYSVGSKPVMRGTRVRFSAGNGLFIPPTTPMEVSEVTHTEEMAVDMQDESTNQKLNLSHDDDVMHNPTSTAPSDLQPEIRPRTATFPWGLLRSQNDAGDPLRPRSSSGGNTRQIRDVIRARLSLTAHSADRLEALRSRTVAATPTERDTSEYMEMHRPTDCYVDLTWQQN